MPDAELVCGILAGRVDFAVLQRRYERRVYGRLYAMVRNPDDAEELTQCVFIRVFKGLGTFDPVLGCFCTWLYSITTNVAMSFFRAQRRAPKSLDALDESQVPMVAGPDELHEARVRRAQLHQSVARLDSMDRGALMGFHVRGLSWHDVAASLGCTERHARYRTMVVIKKLRESL